MAAKAARPVFRSSTGETRPVSLSAFPGRPKRGLPGHAIQRPKLHFRAYSGPLFVRPCGPVFRAPNCPFLRAKSPHPRPQPADGVVISEPFWDDRRGPKTHSRRTGIKLGQVRYARQGLVRVPLSNTKYGGKRGITGVGAAPVMGTSISESSEIPKPKKLFGGGQI
jgi:hypothetical protein